MCRGGLRSELRPHDSEKLVEVQPAPVDTPLQDVCDPVTASSLGKCPHELWLLLGLDDPAWSSYSKFTLRVSSPASVRHIHHLSSLHPAKHLSLLAPGRLPHQHLHARDPDKVGLWRRCHSFRRDDSPHVRQDPPRQRRRTRPAKCYTASCPIHGDNRTFAIWCYPWIGDSYRSLPALCRASGRVPCCPACE